MRLRDTIILFVCVIVVAAMLITAGMQLDFINSQRQKMKLISNEPLKNAPPSLAFATVAMGAFRGLVVDVLWLRADKLKQQGQYFDAKQLAEWITTLQPRFASVWEFQAWNMAYNISVAIPETQPDQRWRWVKNGYELLRDEGIPLNPKSISLYRELARIFQHKIGSFSDAVHEYYKLQLALAMEPLVAPGDEKHFKLLAAAPVSWQQIIRDADVAAFVKSLKDADKIFADESKFVSNYLSLRQNPSRFSPQCFNVIEAFRNTAALEKFDIFAKAYQLRNVWKLDPVLMQQLNEKYGPVDFNDPNEHLPLDWRHPDTHAIYWAVRGLQNVDVDKEQYSLDEANTDRIINHSLQNLFHYGKIFIYTSPGEVASDGSERQLSDGREQQIYLRPDLQIFDSYNKSTLAIMEKYKDVRQPTYESMLVGYRNMLTNAILAFYQVGHTDQAQRIYDEFRRMYPSAETKQPLVIFVRARLREELKRMNLTDVQEMVQMLLRESYFRYAMRDDDEAFGREKMAKEIYDNYQSMYSDQERINLPDIRLLRYFSLIDFLNDRQYPENLRLALVGRIRVERPELARQLEQQEAEMQKRTKEQNQR